MLGEEKSLPTIPPLLARKLTATTTLSIEKNGGGEHLYASCRIMEMGTEHQIGAGETPLPIATE